MPQTKGAIYFHAMSGLQDKGRAIKGLDRVIMQFIGKIWFRVKNKIEVILESKKFMLFTKSRLIENFSNLIYRFSNFKL